MELYVSGVKVPKLHSIQDKMARAYLTKKVVKEVSFNKILAQIAVGVGGPDSKNWSREIGAMWSNYANQAFYMDDEVSKREQEMQEEFQTWKQVTPEIHFSKEGLKLTKLKGYKPPKPS